MENCLVNSTENKSDKIAKLVYKQSSCLGVNWCVWGALTNFSCKLCLKIFHRHEVAGAPTAPPGYAYESYVE